RFTHISQADLNMLLAFQALIEERNITRASARMHLSQSAMSRILDRLQQTFRDEILIRTHNAYEPTRRALEIYAGLEQVLPVIERLLQGQEFNPAEATGHFRVAATEYGAGVLLPTLMEQMRIFAPGILIELLTLEEDVFRKLESNAIDLAFWSRVGPSTLRS